MTSEKLSGSEFVVTIVESSSNYTLLLNTPFEHIRVKTFKTENEAEEALTNFVSRYNVAFKHGYRIAQTPNEVCFMKDINNESWTAKAINLNEQLITFEESLHK